MLLNDKADVDAPASKRNGRTALEGAAEYGRLDIVQILLNKGAGCGGKDQAQFSRAIALARDNGHNPTADLLETHIDREKQDHWPEMLVDDDDENLIY